MQTVQPLLIEDWDYMQSQIDTHSLEELEFINFVLGAPELSMEYQSALIGFMIMCRGMACSCSAEQKTLIEQVFFQAFCHSAIPIRCDSSEKHRSTFNGLIELRIDISKMLDMEDLWSCVGGAMHPHTVKQMYEASTRLGWQELQTHWKQDIDYQRYFADFQEVKEYALSWIEVLQCAAEEGKGIIILYQ